MNFSTALEHLRQGSKITRRAWRGSEGLTKTWVELQKDMFVRFTEYQIALDPPNLERQNFWRPQAVDMLTNDWEIVE